MVDCRKKESGPPSGSTLIHSETFFMIFLTQEIVISNDCTTLPETKEKEAIFSTALKVGPETNKIIMYSRCTNQKRWPDRRGAYLNLVLPQGGLQ